MLFRYLWMRIAGQLTPREDILSEHRLAFRCWPQDMDINRHMTNSRYLGFCDLGRGVAIIRSGGWPALRARKLAPIVGSSTIRYRRPIKPFERFTLVTRLTAWDDRWVYFEHRFVTAEGVATICIAKLTFVSKSERPSSDEVLRMMGYDGPRPAFAPLHAAKEALDRELAA